MLVKQFGQGALQEETGQNFSWKLYWYATVCCPWRSVLPPLSPITLTVGVQWWGPSVRESFGEEGPGPPS